MVQFCRPDVNGNQASSKQHLAQQVEQILGQHAAALARRACQRLVRQRARVVYNDVLVQRSGVRKSCASGRVC